MDPLGLKGYGPMHGRSHLMFDGEESSFEQWEVKFLAHLSLRKLKKTILGQGHVDPNKNEQAYSEMVQFLDSRSLSLIMRDAPDDGYKALQILREHYAGTSKPRIMSLYTALCTLLKGKDSVTDYVIRAENAATALVNAGEVVSDQLLMAMVMKGLPTAYKPFVVVVNTTDKIADFAEFKTALRSFEENEKASAENNNNNNDLENSRVLQANFQRMQVRDTGYEESQTQQKNKKRCYNCGSDGHLAANCNKRWCNYCKSTTHNEKSCFKKKKNGDQAKQVKSSEADTENHSFDFGFMCKVVEVSDDTETPQIITEPDARTADDHSFDFDYMPCEVVDLPCETINETRHITEPDDCDTDDHSFAFDFMSCEVVDLPDEDTHSFNFGMCETVELSDINDTNVDITSDSHDDVCSDSVRSISMLDNPETMNIDSIPDHGVMCKVVKYYADADSTVETFDDDQISENGNQSPVDSAVSPPDSAKVVDNVSSENDPLLVDTGATSHIVVSDEHFIDVDDTYAPENHYIELADGSRTLSAAKKRGTVLVNITDENNVVRSATLHNALYCPSYPQNIFSVKSATERGHSVYFSRDNSELVSKGGVRFPIHSNGGLYYLYSVSSGIEDECRKISSLDINSENDDTAIPVHVCSISTSISEVQVCDLDMWHKILGHCNTGDILKLEDVVDGMKISDKTHFHCSSCVLGKQTVNRSSKQDPRADTPIEFVHSDVTGPITPVAKDGYRYAITFTDDYTSTIFVYFLKLKSDSTYALKQFIADSAPYGTMKRLRTDNGGEYVSEEFKLILVEHGIKFELTAPYCPHQNGTAERGFRTLFEMARCMLIESNLPKYLWTYAVMCATFIRNRCYNQRLKQTPYYQLTGRRPNLNKMHVFGTVCYGHVNEQKKKLDPRSKSGVFVGYDKNSAAFLIYYSDSKQVKRHGMVTFTNLYPREIKKKGETKADDDGEILVKDVSNNSEINDNRSNQMNDISNPSVPAIPNRNSTRVRNQPDYLRDYVRTARDESYGIDYCYKTAPKTYNDAVRSDECCNWKEAMDEEMGSLAENDTFELVELPPGKHTVGGRWVYAIKPGPDSEDIYKARYVAKGFSQTYGVDYFSTFAPTTRLSTIRMVIQIAVQCDYIIHQMDVKSAYLNAPIDCEVYMEQPKGYEVQSKDGKQYVCKLLKSLYGLKQSASNWREVIQQFFIEHGCKQSEADQCVFMLNSAEGKLIYVIWVDDIIVISNSNSMMEHGKSILKKRFKMKDLGTISRFLGITFTSHVDGSISMDQYQYLLSILERAGMESCNPRTTPCELKASAYECDDDRIIDEPEYRTIVGSLIYAMTCTRPDLSFVVSKLSQHLSRPTEGDWNLLKQVLRYIKGTLNYSLHFTKSDTNLRLTGYSDSDWAGCREDRRSITGYCFQLCDNGPVISWKSRKQPTVALSTCEAEYMALCETSQEAVYLSRVLKDLIPTDVDEPVSIYGDNQGSLDLVRNPVKHNRTKHIDIRYHYIRELFHAQVITVSHVSTGDNVSDVMTKAVSKFKYEKFCPSLFGKL